MGDTPNNAAAPFGEGGLAVAEDGVVLLDGPDGIAISLTPDAAEQTGNSLIEAARTAREQNIRGA
jgi:hypothetical protein